MTKINKLLGKILIVATFLFISLPITVSAGAAGPPPSEGTANSIRGGVGDPLPGSPTINSAIKGGIEFFSFIIGVVAVIMIIYAGLKFITASGDANSLKQAKSMLIFAMVGLVLVIISQTILKIVIVKSTS